MAIVIPDNFGIVSYELALNSDPERMFVTHGIEVEDAGSMAGLATNLWAAFVVSPLTLMGAGYSLEGVKVEAFSGGDPVVEEQTDTAASVSTDEPAPQNCAYLIRKRSASSAKGKSGRMYLPGIVEDFVTPNGMIEPAQLGDVRTTVDEWFTAIIGDAMVANVVLFHSDPLIRHDPDTGEEIEVANPDPTPTPVTSFLVDAQIATQRRRLR